MTTNNPWALDAQSFNVDSRNEKRLYSNVGFLGTTLTETTAEKLRSTRFKELVDFIRGYDEVEKQGARFIYEQFYRNTNIPSSPQLLDISPEIPHLARQIVRYGNQEYVDMRGNIWSMSTLQRYGTANIKLPIEGLTRGFLSEVVDYDEWMRDENITVEQKWASLTRFDHALSDVNRVFLPTKVPGIFLEIEVNRETNVYDADTDKISGKTPPKVILQGIRSSPLRWAQVVADQKYKGALGPNVRTG